jgi:tyrosyl-tRNA synthetase
MGNYVGINEPAEEIFGKLMSISDTLMWRYYELLSFRPMAEVNALKAEVEAGRNPRDVKVLLAQEIVARFHSRAAAGQALAEFEARFRDHAIPENLPEVAIAATEPVALVQVMKQANLVPSTSEAMRMIEQGGVKLDGERVVDRALRLAPGTLAVLQVGKRKFARVRIGA